MNEHLLALELGPVLQFVAAARKTRDMFFGSWMFSEISKAVTKAAVLAAGAGTDVNGKSWTGREHDLLIVPAPTSIAELDSEWFSVGDEILLRVPEGIDPRTVSSVARRAAHAKWMSFANDASDQVLREQNRIGRRLICDDVWHDQVVEDSGATSAGELIEVYAAWVPYSGESSQYAVLQNELKRRMLGRTFGRNFPASSSRSGRPKSSLDGRRDSVLVQPEEFSSEGEKPRIISNRKLRLSRGEQLDAFGVTKRVGGGKKNYPSTARIAADPWIRGARKTDRSAFDAMIGECRKLAAQQNQSDEDPVLGRINVSPSEFQGFPQYASFPFEGAILFENRHHEFLQEADLLTAEGGRRSRRDALRPLLPFRTTLQEMIKKHGVPDSYYAALVADGDRIGAALRRCQGILEHREFSTRLSKFTASVREIVQQHFGALVFAAGEDITALLPLDQVIPCANELRLSFESVINEGHPERNATLSVGIAIGHFLDALEDTLAAARAMESWAKGFPEGTGVLGKNALAVTYVSRGGAPIQFRRSWQHDPKSSIDEWIRQLDSGNLPDKVAYDLRNVANFYAKWTGPADRRKQAMHADLLRLLSKKRASARHQLDSLIQDLESPSDVVELANTIIISGVIGMSQHQARGRGMNVTAENAGANV